MKLYLTKKLFFADENILLLQLIYKTFIYKSFMELTKFLTWHRHHWFGELLKRNCEKLLDFHKHMQNVY